MTDEPTCDWLAMGHNLEPRERCNATAIVLGTIGYRRCRAHAQLASACHLLTEGELLDIIAAVVDAAEDECRTGHTIKRDEVALGVWRALVRVLAKAKEDT